MTRSIMYGLSVVVIVATIAIATVRPVLAEVLACPAEYLIDGDCYDPNIWQDNPSLGISGLSIINPGEGTPSAPPSCTEYSAPCSEPNMPVVAGTPTPEVKVCKPYNSPADSWSVKFQCIGPKSECEAGVKARCIQVATSAVNSNPSWRCTQYRGQCTLSGGSTGTCSLSSGSYPVSGSCVAVPGFSNRWNCSSQCSHKCAYNCVGIA